MRWLHHHSKVLGTRKPNGFIDIVAETEGETNKICENVALLDGGLDTVSLTLGDLRILGMFKASQDTH